LPALAVRLVPAGGVVGVSGSVRPRDLEQLGASSRTFRIVEVSSGTVLAEGVDMRATVDVLSRIDSIFDVSVAVWDPRTEEWRVLSPGEQRALWDVRER
jgi:hypothetical protein